MKKTIIDRLLFLLISVLTLIPAGKASASPADWAVSPSDFRYDMSLYFTVAIKATGVIDYDSYDVAAFYGDQCRGVAQTLDLPDGSRCLSMRVRSNVESGEDISFKIRNRETGEVTPIEGVTIPFVADSRVGYPSDPYAMVIVRYFDVTVTAGAGGSVDFASGRYEEGTVLTLTAVPAEGHSFEAWSDGVTEASREVTVTEDITLEASFVVNSYDLVYVLDGTEISRETVLYGTELTPADAPVKEGYTFSGWSEMPATMPAHEVTVTGSFSINSYTVTFRIGNEFEKSFTLEYGAEIVAPEAPAKEGHTFAGWQDVPAVVPAHDVTVLGSYTVNVYKLVYMVDGEEYLSQDVAFGTELTPTEAPEKEGHTFSGWSEMPATMPAHDVTVTGSFSINSYTVTFLIGDEFEKSFTLEYGAEIVAPEAPAKEGHTFAGWQDMPAVVPAHDVTVLGSYTVNLYKLVYMVDGEEYLSQDVAYGTDLTPADAPVKEGYTFSGWSEMPATMPAHEVTVTGSFTINSYTVTFRIGDEFEKSFTLEFGAEIVAPEAPAKEGYTFAGWQHMPAVVPAHDVTVLGSYTVNLYKLVYMVDGEEYLSQDVAYGTELTPAEAPVKEGYTFSGWSEMPATMPAHDVTVAGSFAINSYTVTFRIGDEFEKSFTLEFGAKIVAPEAPAKEGHTFAGWHDMPAVVPAHDVTILGSYTVNLYKLVYMVDGEEYLSQDIAYGTELTPAEAPEKEGYTFSGWSEVPATMPAHEVTVTGSFTINSYTVTFRIDDEFEKSFTLEFGAEIVAPEAPAKEGYTFAGWQDMPAVVPAHDVTVLGSYTVNVYKLIYMVDGEEYLSQDVAYGTELAPAEAPVKEGHTFSGWSEMPATMPAHDVTVAGSFAINSYMLTVLLNEMPYFETILEYGAPIEIPEPEIPDDMEFCGWEPEPPATMPAHDLVINGTTRTLSGLERMIADGVTQVTVHTLTGVCLYRDASPETIKERLQPGIYIVNGRKVILK